MKITRIIVGIVPCLAFAFTGWAQTSTFDWQFPTILNPASPTAAINPYGATATATISGNNTTYFFGTGPEGFFGTRTGLWDIEGVGGQMELGLDLGAASVVDIILKLTQFVDNGGLYPGTLSFSSPNVLGFTTANALPNPVRTVVEQQTGNMIGYWVQDTYVWNPMAAPAPIRLDIAPATNSVTGIPGAMMFDEVELTVQGELANIPEPSASQMAAAGLLAFGVYSWFRRKVKA